MSVWLCLALAAAPAEPSFEARFAALEKGLTSGAIAIRPVAKGEKAKGSEPVLVANERTLFTPAVIGPEDVAKAVQDNKADLAACYEAALEKEPGLEVKIILDIAVKKNGRVAELALSPKRENESPLGVCLLSRIPRWKFPEFTGEVEEGVTQEVVSLAVPLSFASKSN